MERGVCGSAQVDYLRLPELGNQAAKEEEGFPTPLSPMSPPCNSYFHKSAPASPAQTEEPRPCACPSSQALNQCFILVQMKELAALIGDFQKADGPF